MSTYRYVEHQFSKIIKKSGANPGGVGEHNFFKIPPIQPNYVPQILGEGPNPPPPPTPRLLVRSWIQP